MFWTRFPARAALAATVAASLLGGCTNEPTGPAKSPYEMLQAKVGADAVMSMTRADYGKTYARIGAKQFDNANALMPWAAIAAAESEKCDSVEMVAVSDKATRKELQWFVDCANKERFQIKQAQAEAARGKYDPAASPEARQAAQKVAAAEPKSARWSNFNEANAVSACDLMVQQAMLVPGSFSTGFNRWDIEKDDDSGLVTIQRDFKSENAYSMKINGRYHCVIDTNKAAIKTLKIREPDGWRKLI